MQLTPGDRAAILASPAKVAELVDAQVSGNQLRGRLNPQEC